jgi:SAM-dependent methyltransferase
MLVGEFEQMYQDYDDPWQQTTREEWTSEKAVALNLIKKLKPVKVIELGCGLGHFTKKISDLGVDILGLDISTTAIQKAKNNYPNCNFAVGDILDFEIYREYKPDVIVMAEITWYVLEKLDYFLEFLRTETPKVYLIHLLTTYPAGIQKYGKDRFTNLKEIMSYFGAKYLEWGEISYPEMEGCNRTYFLGQLKPKK